ncbi:unnamed protein product [Dibothriocephalus latus]|uniref:Uncharacterized protein n=1 Tax=Dibothriocephalus latus TaxID=60516 RepID=A0A3P7LMT2_DIBLA|nr:unnamed protein product [Dibothriocephalus latus]
MDVRRRANPSQDEPILNRTYSSLSSDTQETSSVEPTSPLFGVSIIHWLVILCVLLALTITVPPVAHECSLSGEDSNFGKANDSFNCDAVRKHLSYVTGLGPRTCGSIANEVHAKDYLITQLRDLEMQAKKGPIQGIFKQQISSYSSFKTHSHVTSYNNLPNLLFRLHDSRSNSSKPSRAILVNCHYDTAPGSPGASDAFVSCANNLEVIHVLLKARTVLLQDVIFLFNSAEESILPASHAFVTQHEWAEDVALFINLEGAGAGGKLLVFQSGPGMASSVLIDVYSKATHRPSAEVMAEEIFQFGLIPSDTDFRIFRDYGLIPGLDLAYVADGYSYHTLHDVQERISPACLRLAGENLLSLVRTMAADPRIVNLPKLEITRTESHMPVSDESPEGSLGSIHASSSLGRQPDSSLGYATHSWGCRMTWFTNRYNIFGVFFLPLLTFCTFFHTSFFKIPNARVFRLFPFRTLLKHSLWIDRSQNCPQLNSVPFERDFFQAALLILNIPLILTLALDSPASYLPALWCGLTLTFHWVYLKWASVFGGSPAVKSLFLIIPPLLLFHIASSAMLLDVFIPIFGRSGQLMKPDVTVACILFIVSWPVLIFVADLWHFTSAKSARTMRYLLVNGCITFTALVHTSPIGFPYTILPEKNAHLFRPSQQRVAVFHANRAFRDNITSSNITYMDSGIFILPLDTNEFRDVTEFPELSESRPFICHRDHPYCGMPLLYPLLHAFNTFFYLPAEPHKSVSAKMHIVNRTLETKKSPELHENFTHVNLTLSVDSYSPHAQFLIRFQPQGIHLVSWSFAPEAGYPQPVPMPGRSPFEQEAYTPSAHYLINHFDPSGATSPSRKWTKPWVFWLEFAVSSMPCKDGCEDFVDLALVNHFSDDRVPNGKSEALSKMVARLPKWTVPASWLSSYEHWRVNLLASQ